jgi:hypothetical protein
MTRDITVRDDARHDIADSDTACTTVAKMAAGSDQKWVADNPDQGRARMVDT